MPGWGVLLLVFLLLVVFGFLCCVFGTCRKVLVWFLKGSFWAVAIPVEVLYVVLVWWWLAIVRKARGEEVPPVWLFARRR